jgi:hypothetical protein
MPSTDQEKEKKLPLQSLLPSAIYAIMAYKPHHVILFTSNAKYNLENFRGEKPVP